MKVFFFGAGSSCGTVGALVAARFGCALAAIDANWRTTYPALFQVVQHLGLPHDNWSLEAVWSCIDYYAKFQPAIGTPKWVKESPQLKKALLRVYGQRCDAQARDLPDNESYTLGKILKTQPRPGDYLISFNYDTIVERLAIRLGICLRSAATAKANYAIVLVKPHGSTSWSLERAAPLTNDVSFVASDGSPLLDALTDADVDAGREPLVLGAVPIKSELLREVQQCSGAPNVFDTIQEQWREVVKAICDADSIVVLGYSFPKEDHYGHFLMQEGVRRRKGKPLDITFYDLQKARPQIEENIRDVFGACKLTFCGPVTGPVT